MVKIKNWHIFPFIFIEYKADSCIYKINGRIDLIIDQYFGKYKKNSSLFTYIPTYMKKGMIRKILKLVKHLHGFNNLVDEIVKADIIERNRRNISFNY